MLSTAKAVTTVSKSNHKHIHERAQNKAKVSTTNKIQQNKAKKIEASIKIV